MKWVAVVPLKAAGRRKSRLAARLSAPERHRLSDAMFRHVISVLALSPQVARIAVLSSDPPPADLEVTWLRERGGLNASLASALRRSPTENLLIIHADLPMLGVDDVAALLATASRGLAIAPDRRRKGTNALAIPAGRRIAFAFGEDSLARHLSGAEGEVGVLERAGLGFDLDTPDDLDDAVAAGAVSWRGAGLPSVGQGRLT